MIEKNYPSDSLGSLQDIKLHLTELRKQCVDTSISLMIVEDNPMNLHVSQMLFKKVGCRVIYPATSGQDALDQLAKLDTPPDLIVLDYLMPGMDGCQTADAIHAYYTCRNVTPPVMLGLTGSLTKELQKKAQNHHFKHMFAKPITLAKIMDMIEFCTDSQTVEVLPMDAEELAKQVINDINGYATAINVSDVKSLRKQFEGHVCSLETFDLSEEDSTYLQIMRHSGGELLNVLYSPGSQEAVAA